MPETKNLPVKRVNNDPLAPFVAALDQKMAEMKATLAGRINPDVFKRFVLTDLRRNSKLAECSHASLLGCVVTASQFALMPGTKQIYFVPFGKEATPIIGYTGLVELAKRGGNIKKIEARAVHSKDQFFYQYGTDPKIEHTPSLEADPGPVTHVYAIAFSKDGTTQFDVMTDAETEKIRKRSRAGENGPWITDRISMQLKTIVRRLSKLLDQALFPPEVVEQLNHEDEVEFVKVADATVLDVGRRKIGAKKEDPQSEVEQGPEPESGTGKTAPAPSTSVADLKHQLKTELAKLNPEESADCLFAAGIDSLNECQDAAKLQEALAKAKGE